MTKTKKIGRPKLPKGEAKSVFSLRLSEPDQKQIESAAKRKGKPVTQWARETLLAASTGQ
jgi:predicted HicB family RNase H-like nuclease